MAGTPDSLCEFVRRGVHKNARDAYDAIDIGFQIGHFHQEIRDKGYGSFFAQTKLWADHVALASIRKIFEAIGKQYHNRSLLSTIEKFKTTKPRADFSDVHLDFKNYKALNDHKTKIKRCIDTSDLSGLLDVLCREVPKVENGSERELDLALDRVRRLADKEVAHNEDVMTIEQKRAPYADCMNLLGFVENTFDLLIFLVCSFACPKSYIHSFSASLLKLLSVFIALDDAILQQYISKRQSFWGPAAYK